MVEPKQPTIEEQRRQQSLQIRGVTAEETEARQSLLAGQSRVGGGGGAESFSGGGQTTLTQNKIAENRAKEQARRKVEETLQKEREKLQSQLFQTRALRTLGRQERLNLSRDIQDRIKTLNEEAQELKRKINRGEIPQRVTLEDLDPGQGQITGSTLEEIRRQQSLPRDGKGVSTGTVSVADRQGVLDILSQALLNPFERTVRGLITTGREASEKVFSAIDIPRTVAAERLRQSQSVEAAAGKQEFFGGRDPSELRGFESRGTAVVTEQRPFTREELIKNFPFGAGEEIIRREKSKIDFETQNIIDKGIEQNLPEVQGNFNKELSKLVERLQNQINNNAISLPEAQNLYEKRAAVLAKEFEDRLVNEVLKDTKPDIKTLEKESKDYLKNVSKVLGVSQAIALSPFDLALGAGLGFTLKGASLGARVGRGVLTGASILQFPQLARSLTTRPIETGVRLGATTLGGLLGARGLRDLQTAGRLSKSAAKNTQKRIARLIDIEKQLLKSKRGSLQQTILRKKRKKKRSSSEKVQDFIDALDELKEQGNEIEVRKRLTDFSREFKKKIEKLSPEKKADAIKDFEKFAKILLDRNIISVQKRVRPAVRRQETLSPGVPASQLKPRGPETEISQAVSPRIIPSQLEGQTALQRNIQRVREAQLKNERQTQFNKLSLGQRFQQAQQIRQRQNQALKTGLSFKQAQKLRQRQRQKFKTALLTRQTSLLAQRSALRLRPKLKLTRPRLKKPRVKIPKIPVPGIDETTKKRLPSEITGQVPKKFDVFSRKRGKLVRINPKPFKSQELARDFGAREIDKTLRASFIVRPTTRRGVFRQKDPIFQGSFRSLQGKFRPAKSPKLKGFFVERERFRLEKGGIETKRIQQLRKKPKLRSVNLMRNGKK